MMRTRRCAAGRGAWVVIGAVLLGAPAQAIQFTPDANDRVHSPGSGQPGVEWNTGANGTIGGQINYDGTAQEISITGAIDVMNFFNTVTPNRGALGTCGSDAGSNCSLNYGPDLNFTVEAGLATISTELIFGNFHTVTIFFETTSDGIPDIVWTDPSDSNAVVLEASWVAGIFGGDFTHGLKTAITYDALNEVVFASTLTIEEWDSVCREIL